MLATLACKTSGLLKRRVARSGRDLRAVLVSVLLVLVWAGCDDAPAPPPPPQQAPAAATPAPAPKAPEVVKPSPPAEQAAPTAAAPAAALPTADKVSQRARLLDHYRALHCLSQRGAGADEIAAAFVASGLTPQAWQAAFDAALDDMAAEPGGEVARALAAADAQPCAEGGAP